MLLKINFRNERYKRFPKVKIFVDDDLLEEKAFTSESQTVSIPIELMDGEHLLEIEHFDKTEKDTLVTQGKITKDTNTTITSIMIDGYELPASALYGCELRATWDRMTKPPGFPDVIKQGLKIGPNGVWSLKFYTPVLDWLINQRKAKEKTTDNVVTYESYELSPHSQLDYELTEEDKQIIQEIKDLICQK